MKRLEKLKQHLQELIKIIDNKLSKDEDISELNFVRLNFVLKDINEELAKEDTRDCLEYGNITYRGYGFLSTLLRLQKDYSVEKQEEIFMENKKDFMEVEKTITKAHKMLDFILTETQRKGKNNGNN